MRAPLTALAFASLVAVACKPHPPGPQGSAHRADGGPSAAAHTDSDAGQDPCGTLTPEQRTTVVARVGDSTLTLCDFAQRISLQNQYLRARFQAPEQRRALLRSWVDAELLAVEARNRGLDRDPHVQHAITSQLARQLETELRTNVQAPEVTDAEIEQYYTAHRAEYDTPEQVRASQIVLGSRDRAERVLADVRAHASDDAYWRTVAGRESTDPITRGMGGDLGFFGAHGAVTVVPEVATAAFTLHQPGEIAPTVIESANGGPNHGPGFHIVRFVSRRDAVHRSLDEVRRAIRNRLWRERFDRAQNEAVHNLIETLRRQTPVTIDDNALSQIRLDVTPISPQPGAATDAGASAPGAR